MISRNIFSQKRFWVICALLIALGSLVVLRVLDLDSLQKSFLLNQGDYESVHYQTIPGIRGMVFDRNHVPLAVSAPLEDIILDPKILLSSKNDIAKLAHSSVIHMDADSLYQALNAHPNSHYYLLTKNLSPQDADQLLHLKIPGVFTQTHYVSYYPLGESTATLVGFTDANNKGQDGLELSLDKTLGETDGKEAVMRNALGNIIGVVQIMSPAHSGEDITLSIDSRMQFIAYQALKDQVQKLNADSGSVVILDPKTGEVLAAASYPSFNPNDPSDRTGAKVKATAITDTFEPGSTMKVFTIAAALAHGQYTPTTPIDTSPGTILIGGHLIRDDTNEGLTDVTGVLKYSSNVGVSKIALSQPWDYTYDMIKNVGYGQPPGDHFPAEASGVLAPLKSMSKLEFTNIAFGYHVSVSTLQLARAFTSIANQGILLPVSFIKLDSPPAGVRVMPASVAQDMLTMMHTVMERGGTGVRANIKGYDIAGKTGTSHIAGPHGYYPTEYNGMFVGIIPMEDPRLVIAVHITNPHKSWPTPQGAISAAPVFNVIAGSLMRILGIPANANSTVKI